MSLAAQCRTPLRAAARPAHLGGRPDGSTQAGGSRCPRRPHKRNWPLGRPAAARQPPLLTSACTASPREHAALTRTLSSPARCSAASAGGAGRRRWGGAGSAVAAGGARPRHACMACRKHPRPAAHSRPTPRHPPTPPHACRSFSTPSGLWARRGRAPTARSTGRAPRTWTPHCVRGRLGGGAAPGPAAAAGRGGARLPSAAGLASKLPLARPLHASARGAPQPHASPAPQPKHLQRPADQGYLPSGADQQMEILRTGGHMRLTSSRCGALEPAHARAQPAPGQGPPRPRPALARAHARSRAAPLPAPPLQRAPRCGLKTAPAPWTTSRSCSCA